MAVAHNALAAILGLEIRMLGEKIRDLGLDRLRQQRASPLPQDFGELIVKGSWLNQFEHAIVGHGISLLQWRSGVVKQPHDMPPFRFWPSPTSSNSSTRQAADNGGEWGGPLGRLKPHFHLHGDAVFYGCWAGSNAPLMIALARTLGVTVYGGTKETSMRTGHNYGIWRGFT